jgi:LCP family protein required for cell wall assembly
MKKKLRVPAPPSRQPVPRRKTATSGRKRPTARRKKRSGWTTGLLLVLALPVALVVLWQCALLADIPSLLLPQDGNRINLLVVGIDRRSGTDWAYRTDTIIVLTTDPSQRTAGMLSIPRDLQLPIPTHGEDRINTANVYGYLEEYPGGGPALLEATIAANFGVPMDGYIMIDFQTFVRIVDALGGIDVDVPQTLHDTRYPAPKPGDPYAYKTVHFDPGWQHMDGARALEYARSRMSTSDFDRARRQQQILLALRKKALRLDTILRAPALLAATAGTMKTDFSLTDLIGLAGLAVTVDSTSLKQVVLAHPLVYGYQRADGADVQLPNWDLINPVLADLFGSP